MLLLAGAVSIPCLICINVRIQHEHGQTIFKDDPHSRGGAYSRLAAIPVICSGVNWFVQHLRKTTFWWENHQLAARWFDPLSFSLMVIAALSQLRGACLCVLDDNAADSMSYYLEIIIVLIVLRLYFALLDGIDDIMKGMVADQEMINRCRPVQKMQQIVGNITRTGKREKDFIYCFADANTVPAEVLSYIWWVYFIFGKMAGVCIAIAIFMRAEEVAGRVVLGGLLLSTAASSGVAFELGPNTISLLRLSLYKPFYVGDLITASSNGATGAPTSSIMGFVENITMMYVVIRNFEMKQTWVSHKMFNEMVIQNWTRRPTKTVLLNIGISCRCPLARVEQLTEFAKNWISASTEIQQTNYKKFHITKISNGYNIEIIFFPVIGVSHRGIRQKFLVAFMKAGERLKVPFVPLDIMTNYCDDSCVSGASNAAQNTDGAADDAAPSAASPVTANLDDLMPDPNDLLPKGVE